MNVIPRVMIDFETPSSEKTAGILTFGAVQFNLPFGTLRPRFYERASLASNEGRGLTVSKETMEWWDGQSQEMREEAFGGKRDIADVLLDFENWCATSVWSNLQEIELWSRGAGFDCEILQHAFYKIHGYYPFDFRKHMCQRTVERLMPQGLKAAIPPQIRKHHAIYDTEYQADVIDVALRNLSWGGSLAPQY